MSLYSDILMEQLIEAWQKLQETYFGFDQTPDSPKEYSRRYDAVLLALMGWIAKKTKYGDQPGPTPWHYTKQFLADYDKAADLPKVIEAFVLVGVQDETDAGVWLAEQAGQIP